MELYQAACVSNAAASNWLALRLQLLAAVLLSAVAATAAYAAAVLFSSSSSSSSSSSGWAGDRFRIDLLGLALAYCLPLVNLLNGLLTSSAETEQDMVAVERVAALLADIRPEAAAMEQGSASSDAVAVAETRGSPQQQRQQAVRQQQQQRQWVERAARRWRLPRSSLPAPGSQQLEQQGELTQPLLRGAEGAGAHAAPTGSAAVAGGGSGGGCVLQLLGAAGAAADPSAPALELRGVVLRYRPHLPPALRGVSFAVPAGQRLGVCGRTGARRAAL
jgi:ABC-type multidrug transport system fused ATPase/permease subunit